jgi:hypothetical protein
MLNYGYFVYIVHYMMLVINIYLNFPPLFQYVTLYLTQKHLVKWAIYESVHCIQSLLIH